MSDELRGYVEVHVSEQDADDGPVVVQVDDVEVHVFVEEWMGW